METTSRQFGEVLNDGVRVLGAVWKSLITPALGAYIPLGALTLLTFQATGANQFLEIAFNDPTSVEGMTREEFLEIAIPFVQGVLIVVVLEIVASAFIALAVTRVVAAKLEGAPITGGAASRMALSKMFVMVIAGLVAGVGIAVGLVLLIIPGIWLAVSLSMLPHVVALEDQGALGSLSRSVRLVGRRWFPTAAFVLLVAVMGLIAGQMLQFVALPLLAVGELSTALALAFVVGLVLQGLVVAAIAVMTTMWYFDLRARHDPPSLNPAPT